MTNDGDSINCKIIDKNSEFIYFSFKYEGEIRNTLIPLSRTRYFKRNFYDNNIVSVDQIIGYRSWKRYRLGINGGFSQITSSIPENLTPVFIEYVRELRTGYHLGADLTYYFHPNIGLGLNYDRFRTTNTLPFILILDPATALIGNLSDDITVTYIAPMLSTRIFTRGKKDAIFMNLMIGQVSYTNQFEFINRIQLTGKTIGAGIDIGYDAQLLPDLSLGIQASYLYGSMTEYEIDSGSAPPILVIEQERNNASGRFDLSIGLRLYY